MVEDSNEEHSMIEEHAMVPEAVLHAMVPEAVLQAMVPEAVLHAMVPEACVQLASRDLAVPPPPPLHRMLDANAEGAGSVRKRDDAGSDEGKGVAVDKRFKGGDVMQIDQNPHAIGGAASDALNASLLQAQTAIQTMMGTAANNGGMGWWGGMPGAGQFPSFTFDGMRQQQHSGQNPQFTQALEMLEQAVAMARAAGVSENFVALEQGGIYNAPARKGGAHGVGRAGGFKKERTVPGEKVALAADRQCPRCYDLISRPDAYFGTAAVCGTCADILLVRMASKGEAAGSDGTCAWQIAGAGANGGGGHRVLNEKQVRNVLTAEGAMRIFKLKEHHRTRDDLSERLASEYGITPKAVRDIWNLRTWMNTTRMLWTPADHQRFLGKKLCEECQKKGVAAIAQACDKCRERPTKGRPPTKVDEEKLKTLFSMPQVDAAKELGISLATLKSACRRLGYLRWPFDKDDPTGGLYSQPLPQALRPPPAPPQVPLASEQQQPLELTAGPEIVAAAEISFGGVKPPGGTGAGRVVGGVGVKKKNFVNGSRGAGAVVALGGAVGGFVVGGVGVAGVGLDDKDKKKKARLHEGAERPEESLEVDRCFCVCAKVRVQNSFAS